MTEAERDELTKLQGRVARLQSEMSAVKELREEVTLIRGFINFHWGPDSWRKWLEAVELTKHRINGRVAAEPVRDAYIDSEG